MEENLNKQLTETLTLTSLERGRDLLQKGRAAQKLGDTQTLEQVEDAILSDLSFGEAVKEKINQKPLGQTEVADNDQRQEDGKENDKIEAQKRLSKVVNEIKDLYKELVKSAIENRNPGGTFDSIGEEGEKNLRTIVEKVTHLLDTGSPEDVEEAMKTLNVDGYSSAITHRVRGLVSGYFQGNMPDQLRSQVLILDRIKDAHESLKTANSDWQKLKEQS